MALPPFRQHQIPTLLYKHTPAPKTFAPHDLHNHAMKSRAFSTTPPSSGAKETRGRRYVVPRKGVHARPTFKLAPSPKDLVAGTHPPVHEERKRALQLSPRLADPAYRAEVLARERKMDAAVERGGVGTKGMSDIEYAAWVGLKKEALAATALDPLLGGKREFEHRWAFWRRIEDAEAGLMRRRRELEDKVVEAKRRAETGVGKGENSLAVAAILGVYGVGIYWFFY
ncbi:hypothetical protein BDV97DRAFT_355584 [Delphinella strobiligena]|nr:hypothetical protein BDV97DRAFT_355584 [Delphinella strobiligena]